MRPLYKKQLYFYVLEQWEIKNFKTTIYNNIKKKKKCLGINNTCLQNLCAEKLQSTDE